MVVTGAEGIGRLRTLQAETGVRIISNAWHASMQEQSVDGDHGHTHLPHSCCNAIWLGHVVQSRQDIHMFQSHFPIINTMDILIFHNLRLSIAINKVLSLQEHPDRE